MRSLKNAVLSLLKHFGVYSYCILRLLLSGPAPCRFTPTCGPYTLNQLKTQPFLHAIRAICKRVWHCSPWGL